MEYMSNDGRLIIGGHNLGFSPRGRVRAEGNLTFDEFAELLVTLGKQALPDVLITADDPDVNTKTPVVTFGIIHEAPFPSEVKPRIRDTFDELRCTKQDKSGVCTDVSCTNHPYWNQTCGHGTYPPDASRFDPEGKSVVVWGQRFKTVVQFNCWDKSGTAADKLTRRFKEFMFTYTGVFKLKGVAEILFQERLTDRLVTKWQDDVFSRSLRYMFHFEELYVQQYDVIRQIIVQLSDYMRSMTETHTTSFNGNIAIA